MTLDYPVTLPRDSLNPSGDRVLAFQSEPSVAPKNTVA